MREMADVHHTQVVLGVRVLIGCFVVVVASVRLLKLCI